MNRLTVIELKAIALSKGLKTWGSKLLIIERINKFDLANQKETSLVLVDPSIPLPIPFSINLPEEDQAAGHESDEGNQPQKEQVEEENEEISRLRLSSSSSDDEEEGDKVSEIAAEFEQVKAIEVDQAVKMAVKPKSDKYKLLKFFNKSDKQDVYILENYKHAMNASHSYKSASCSTYDEKHEMKVVIRKCSCKTETCFLW